MKKVFGIYLALVIIAMLLAGCKSGGAVSNTTSSSTGVTTTHAAATSSTPATSSAATITSTAPKTTTAATSTTPATTSAVTTTSTAPKTTTTAASSTPATSGNDFSSIIGKSSGIASFYCEVKITSPDGVQNMKEWIKTGNPTKFRMEISASGTTSVIIFDGQNYYMYDTSSKMAYKMSAASASQYSSSSGDAGSATQYNPVLIGSETVNGVDCYVYQYAVQGVTTKMWLSKQNGLTLKIVSGTTTMEYTNYSFSAIADSTFQLPADAIIMTIPGM